MSQPIFAKDKIAQNDRSLIGLHQTGAPSVAVEFKISELGSTTEGDRHIAPISTIDFQSPVHDLDETIIATTKHQIRQLAAINLTTFLDGRCHTKFSRLLLTTSRHQKERH